MIFYIKLPHDHPHYDKCLDYWDCCAEAQRVAINHVHKYEKTILDNDVATDGKHLYLRNMGYIRWMFTRKEWWYDKPPWLRMTNVKGPGTHWGKQPVPLLIKPNIVQDYDLAFDSRHATTYFMLDGEVYAEVVLINGVIRSLQDVEFLRTSSFYQLVERIEDENLKVPVIMTSEFSTIKHVIKEEFMPWLHE